ncbi:MAG: hypothetical protein MJZ26_09205 [Fibrobacter sp.]|nr:hypothetical protein [Fibrobacter sp.]
MRAFNIYLEQYDWMARIYVAVTHLNTREVTHALMHIGCRGRDLDTAYAQLARGNENTGICYTNKMERMSVVVIGRTSSAKEFLNSLMHETGHLACHIAQQFRISTEGEEICYIMGDIAMKMYPKVRDLLCQHCREH